MVFASINLAGSQKTADRLSWVEWMQLTKRWRSLGGWTNRVPIAIDSMEGGRMRPRRNVWP